MIFQGYQTIMMYNAKIVLFLVILGTTLALPEQGKFSATLTQKSDFVGFVKTLYQNSTAQLKVTNANCDGNIKVTWLLRSSTCYGEYEAIAAESNPHDTLKLIFVDPADRHETGTGMYLKSNHETVECKAENTLHIFTDYTAHSWIPYPKEKPTTTPAKSIETPTVQNRKRRADETKEDLSKNDGDHDSTPDEADNTASKADETRKATDSKNEADTAKEDSDTENGPSPTKNNEKSANAVSNPEKADNVAIEKHTVARVPHAAPYILIVQVQGPEKFSVDINVELKTPLGYLSAHDYPLKTFYMIMCIIYSLYAFAWLVMSACNFRDLLRVQFWIGGVILLGMIEKAVFYSEYLTINSTGVSVMGAVKFAEVVSALKRSLARMLVIIVSLGFGIVKPRLGPMLHRVIGIGILYFIVAIVEALVRNDASNHPGNNNQIFAAIPLAIIDSIICWWIFMSLMQTMKTLRLRRNVVKLSLYRHFSNTIIFCVLASLAMIIYSFRYRDACETAWKEKWIDQAFWHILFSIILLVIMVLWRPNVNNQRYAFSPLLDADAEEGAEEPMLGSGATETVKMRGLKNLSERRDPASNAEDNLKWIEENIPETLADAALPAIMDSDEEIVASKYEMSKME